eukprot:COSAG01_NODE_316_length_19004_cov_100.001322_21_plen_105_part_00
MPKRAVDNCRYCGWAVCAECMPEGSDLAVDRWVSSTGRHPLKWADRENVVQWKWCTHFVGLIFGAGGRAAPATATAILLLVLVLQCLICARCHLDLVGAWLTQG